MKPYQIVFLRTLLVLTFACTFVHLAKPKIPSRYFLLGTFIGFFVTNRKPWTV